MTADDALVCEALQHFVVIYNQSYSGELRFVQRLQPRRQQPPEPDALCLLNGEELGVEVAHLYGTGQDAERITGNMRKRRNPLSKEALMQKTLKPLRERVIAELNNNILAKKATKHYSRSPVWLLVRNMFPAMNRHDFERYRDEIIVPDGHPFRQIWLLSEHDGGLLQLR